MDRILRLPLRATILRSYYGVYPIVIRELRITDLAPTAISPPELHRSYLIEVRTEVLCRVDIHPSYCAWRVRTVCRQDSTIIVSMVLQDDVTNIDRRILLTTTEVKDEHHLAHINTRHITLPEDIVLTSFQVDAVSEIEHTVVTIQYQFHSSTVQVLVTI